MSEFKPCPRCKEALRLSVQTQHEFYGPDESLYFFVLCSACGHSSYSEYTREEAIKDWNTRPIEDALRTENEALKAEIAELEEGIKEKDDAFDDLKEAVYNVLEADGEYTYEGEFCETSDFAICLDDVLTTKQLVELMAKEIYNKEKAQRDKQWDSLPECIENEQLKAKLRDTDFISRELKDTVEYFKAENDILKNENAKMRELAIMGLESLKTIRDHGGDDMKNIISYIEQTLKGGE